MAAMQDVLAMTYYWLKAGHIIFVIFWMAGLFMLPRLFVYHQECPADSPENEKWVARERRLLRIILNPSFVVVVVTGLLLAWKTGAMSDGWFHAKLLVVLILALYHGWLIRYAGELSRGERRLKGTTLRLLNEVPGVAAAIIVVLVVVKPF